MSFCKNILAIRYVVGFRQRLLVRFITILLAWLPSLALSASYTVTDNSGSVETPGSLPWAVQQANYHSPGSDSIAFDIPGASSESPVTIYLDSTLFINEQVNIDATTQPGYIANPPSGGYGFPAVIIDAKGLASAIFLQNGEESTVAGFSIINYSSNAVTIGTGSSANWIRDNFLGLASYSQGSYYELNYSLPYNHSGTRGVGIASSRNVLLRNVISGNDNAVTIGDDISTTKSSEILYRTNSLQFNYVGTDASGKRKLGNTSDGLFLGAGAGETWIGPGNVFSGNDSAGIELLHSSNIGNVIFSNHIGVDQDGTTVIGNGEVGVLISNGAYYNAVGGSWGGNIISGNALGGVVIGLSNPSPSTISYTNLNFIQNNIIGADKTATVPLGFQDVGVSIEGGSTNVVIENNVLGGNITHGVQCYNSSNSSISYNKIGESDNKDILPNWNGFGVFLSNCSNVWIIDNSFGSSGLGNIGEQ